MSTITHPGIIQTMLDNDGVYPGDPQAYGIYEYENVSDWKTYWAVCYDPRAKMALFTSPAVGRCKLLWSVNEGHVNRIGVLKEER